MVVWILIKEKLINILPSQKQVDKDVFIHFIEIEEEPEEEEEEEEKTKGYITVIPICVLQPENKFAEISSLKPDFQ